MKNPIESKVVAAKILNVKTNTPSLFIRRDSTDSRRGKHNKKLQNHEISDLDDFIVVNKFSDENDFIPFENNKNVRFAKHARYARIYMKNML